MKKLLENPAVQATMAWVIASYLKFCYATTKWTYYGQDEMAEIWKHSAIAAFWHERVQLGHAVWPKGYELSPTAILSSQSKSGNVSVMINAHFGCHSIRGSSAKRSDPTKNKGGTAAFLEMMRWLKKGGHIAVTPDGPRGPARIMTDGTLKLAQAGGVPLVFFSAAVKKHKRFDSWDRLIFPFPFNKGIIIWRVFGPIPRDLSDEAFEVMRLAAEKALTDLCDEADTKAAAL
ncbi:MAG: lysophospholipid acyltransferase family protein [Asticcacaulis sp.]